MKRKAWGVGLRKIENMTRRLLKGESQETREIGGV